MKSTAVWENPGLELAGVAQPNGDAAHERSKITALKELTFRLFREVQSLGEPKALNVENGLDFYEEVRRFEIDLIKRALIQTGGHQVRAARLLRLKVTTLNSKIKHYQISLAGFSSYLTVDASETETRQHA